MAPEIDILRREMSERFRLTVEHGRAPESQAFKRAVACEVLRRRGLRRADIGSVLFLSKRGVDFNLSIVSSRARTAPAFRDYLDEVSTDPMDHWIDAVMGDFL